MAAQRADTPPPHLRIVRDEDVPAPPAEGRQLLIRCVAPFIAPRTPRKRKPPRQPPAAALHLPPSQVPLALDRPRWDARPRSIGNGRLTRKERAELVELTTSLGKGHHYARRPKTWGDCQRAPVAPCPWVSCSMNLYLEVVAVPGRPDSPPIIKRNFPGRDIDDLTETCALRVASRGAGQDPSQGTGATLEEVGNLVNLTSQRIDQLVQGAFAKLRTHNRRELLGDDEED